MLTVRNRLGLSPCVSTPTNVNVLKRAGYLEACDSGAGARDWRIVFDDEDNPTAFTLEYRVGAQWLEDGKGNQNNDFVSASNRVYILEEWWGPAVPAHNNQVCFTTEPSDMIEMPVLMEDGLIMDPRDGRSGAAAYTNNVVNCIVSGSEMIAAHVHGPVDGSKVNLFEDYVAKAAAKVQLTVRFVDDTTYHDGVGSLHCASNVLRAIPDDDTEKWWSILGD